MWDLFKAGRSPFRKELWDGRSGGGIFGCRVGLLVAIDALMAGGPSDEDRIGFAYEGFDRINSGLDDEG